MSFPLRRVALICALPALLTTPALADPTVGLGLTFTFGGGQVDTGLGLRVFSDDDSESVVASVGIDYMFRSQSWRGTVGAAYLGEDAYIGLDLGLGLGDRSIDFGISVGGVNTEDGSGGGAPAVTPPPPPPQNQI